MTTTSVVEDLDVLVNGDGGFLAGRWLEERGLAGPFAPHELQGYHRRALPEEVRRYLQFLAPKRKPTTVKTYRQVLGTFHEWLEEQKLSLPQVDRDVCLKWGEHLHACGIGPAARRGLDSLCGPQVHRLALRAGHCRTTRAPADPGE
ncbi:MAG TPA: site-specific integrase [Polyangia bacterium]